jgi:hypothetical protein
MPEKVLSRARRRLTGTLAATAVATVLTPLIAAAPAAATPSAPACPSGAFTGSAAADLLRLTLLDLRPLGVKLSPVADVRLAPTRSGMSASPAQTAAAARYLDANVAGLVGVPTSTAYQQAPPAPPTDGARVSPVGVDLGVLRVGSGDLRARANWQAGYRCGTTIGQTASSSATLADATVLPGAGGRSLLRLPNNLNTATATGLLAQDKRVASSAGAAAGVADLRLFEGTAGQIQVQVITEPTLTVVAGGTKANSSVQYTSPVLKVTLPGGQVQKLDSPGAHLDLALPPSAADAASAAGAARTEGLPMLAGNPLAALLESLHLPATGAAPLGAGSSTSSSTAPGNGSATGSGPAHTESGPFGLPGLPNLSGLPAVGGLLNGVSGPAGTGSAGNGASAAGSGVAEVLGQQPATVAGSQAKAGAAGSAAKAAAAAPGGPAGSVAKAAAGSGALAVLRLSVGSLDKQVTDASVHAQAASLRLQLLLQPAGSPRSQTTVLDLGIGVLEATAAAPKAVAAPVPSPASPSPVAVTGRLPVTGTSLTWMLATGALLAVGGVLLVMLARRRAAG